MRQVKSSWSDVTAANFVYLGPPAVLKVPVRLYHSQFTGGKNTVCARTLGGAVGIWGARVVCRKETSTWGFVEEGIWLGSFCNNFLSRSDIRLRNENHQLEKKIGIHKVTKRLHFV